MKKIAYYLLYGFVYLVSLLPFRGLYLLSDGLYFMVYYIVRYRRKVVRRNLVSSFPEKGIAELQKTERAFYHWFCDYIMETFKLISISKKKFLKHIEFRNVEQLEKCFDEGQSCAAILGHYCNWEWLSATGLAFSRYPDAVMGLIYHPLYNKAFDRLFISIRSALGGTCIPKKDILRYLIKYKQEKKFSLFGYISDQTPKWENIHLWIPFLNHDTPVFTNGEKLMRKMRNAVFYVDMERPSRGHYICTFRLITREPQQLEEFEITRRFFTFLEESIRRQPANYLWTHNRWKRTREEFEQRFRVVEGRIVPIMNH